MYQRRLFVRYPKSWNSCCHKGCSRDKCRCLLFGCFSESQLDSLFHFCLYLKIVWLPILAPLGFTFCHRVATAFYWCLTSHDGLSPRTRKKWRTLESFLDSHPCLQRLRDDLEQCIRDHGSRWRGRFPENKLTFSQRCLLETALLWAKCCEWNFEVKVGFIHSLTDIQSIDLFFFSCFLPMIAWIWRSRTNGDLLCCPPSGNWMSLCQIWYRSTRTLAFCQVCLPLICWLLIMLLVRWMLTVCSDHLLRT